MDAPWLVARCREASLWPLEAARVVRAFTIRSRLIGGFLVIAVLIAGACTIAMRGLRRAEASYQQAVDAYSDRVVAGLELKSALLEQVKAQKNYLLRADPVYLEEASRHAQRVGALRAQLKAAALEGSEQPLLRQLDAAIDSLDGTFRSNVRVRDTEGIEAADRAMRGKAAAAVAIIDELVGVVGQDAREATANAAAISSRTRTVTETLVVCISLLAIGLGVALSLSITRPLRRLQAQIDQLTRQGILPTAPAVEGRSAIADIARAFHEMVQKAALIRELESRSRRLAALSARETQAQEEERARIARELHDGLGQALTAVKMDLSAAARQLGPEASAMRRRVVDARRLIDESLNELRRLVFDLRPATLDNLGLGAALESYARDWQDRTGISATVEADRFEPRLPFQMETALYRICQEALTNVAKHARASRAVVRLEKAEGRVQVVVEDDGIGFDVAASTQSENGPRGVGLLSMERRVAELGGVFNIESGPGKGTRVRVSVPWHTERR